MPFEFDRHARMYDLLMSRLSEFLSPSRNLLKSRLEAIGAEKKKKKKVPPSSPAPIGGFHVAAEANKYICKSDPTSLQISVRDEMNVEFGNGMCPENSEANGDKTIVSGCPDEYMFVLVNPKDDDASTRSCIKELLDLYMKELPAMKYAANTGKKSMFLERCVSKWKYCTLLLKSMSLGASGEIIAAITYQIVPADMQYAEIPLAAVTSIYQNKGFGQLVYKELRKRLQSVGIRAIFCWGDKESEGFWLKQGFASIAEVDHKGKARNLHVKANIRKALCFPGGSTLMLSHVNKGSSVNPTNLLRSCSQPKTHDKSPESDNKATVPGSDQNRDNILKSVKQTNIRIDSFESGDSAKDLTSEGVGCNKMTTNTATGAVYLSDSTKGMKRVWEASLSSLKSKRVKGTRNTDCQLGLDWGLISEKEKRQLKDNSSLDRRHDLEDCRMVCRMTESPVGSKPQPNKECCKIMLMDIADGNKKAFLMKVIENLGGVVTFSGGISTHIVTGKVRKTLNFCTALCSGAWIVSPTWLKESSREDRFLDESSYILHDEEYLVKYQIQLKTAVLRAKARPRALLKGYDVCIAAQVQSAVRTLSAIVRSAGGNVIRGVENVTEASKTIFIACEDDMEEALWAVKKGIRTFSSEWLMNCVMMQELDLEAPLFVVSL